MDIIILLLVFDNIYYLCFSVYFFNIDLKRNAGVYKGIDETSGTFHERGGAAARATDFLHIKKS